MVFIEIVPVNDEEDDRHEECMDHQHILDMLEGHTHPRERRAHRPPGNNIADNNAEEPCFELHYTHTAMSSSVHPNQFPIIILNQ